MTPMIMCIILTLAFLGSAMLTWLLRVYALKSYLIDIPNARSSHSLPTPRGGGLAIVVTFTLGMALMVAWGLISLNVFLASAGAGIIVAVIGFWDDHRHISPGWRVLVHSIASGWALYWLGAGPELVHGPVVWVLVVNIFWLVALVWFLNSYNFMDGVDGIAAAEGVFTAGGAAVLLLCNAQNGFALMVGFLSATVAGFLVWNLPPARIFMGDVGSGFLGLVLGVLAVASMKAGMLSFWVWAILFGTFLADATITVFRRICRGARWYEAHCSHAYQHAARRYGSHGKVTGAVTCINLFWLFPWAVVAWRWPAIGALCALVAYIPLIWLAFRFNAGMDEKKENHKHVQSVAELV